MSRLNEPQFCHLKLLGSWIIYFTMFFITEALIPADACHVVHCRLDDLIPFCEWFLFPYVGWYFLVMGSLLWYCLYDTGQFRQLQIFIMITQAAAMAVYILWPSIQHLRPVEFPRQNLLSRGVAVLYALDTNTNVCPSLHVAYSLGIASVFLKDRNVSLPWKIFITTFVVLVILSTMFLKQHSAVDVLAAIPVCMLAEWAVFRSWWKEKCKKT